MDRAAARASGSVGTSEDPRTDSAVLSGVELRTRVEAHTESSTASESCNADGVQVAVAEIEAITHPVGLEYALAVGGIVIRRLYDGDGLTWRACGETTAFQRLAEHPALPLSAAALSRCVALYELCDRLQAPARWTHLGVGHLRLVLGMPSAIQEKLLGTANAQRWSTGTLEQEVELERARWLARAGKKAPIARSLLSLQKRVEASRQVIDRTSPSIEDAELGIQLLEETQLQLEDLTHSLKSALRATLESANENAEKPGRPSDSGSDPSGA